MMTSTNSPKLIIAILCGFLFFSLMTSEVLAGSLDASFEGVYPLKFTETITGRIAGITVGAAIVAVVLFYGIPSTGGAILAAAKGLYTSVGSVVGQIAGVGSGAAAAGLAILGGGTIASGGFGMAGGMTVITFVVEVGTGIAFETATVIADNNSDKGVLCEELAFPAKLALPEIGRPQIVHYIEELKDLEEKGGASSESQWYNQYKYTLSSLKRELNSVQKSTDTQDLQSILVRAVYNFNNSESKTAIKKDIDFLRENSTKAGFLDYLEGLVEINRRNYNKGIELLTTSSEKEPKQLKPYYWLTYYYRNKRDLDKALLVTQEGIDNLSRQRFPLYWESAKLYYRMGNYKKSAQLFEESYNDINDDSVKIEAAHMIAVSSLKIRDYSEANKWHEISLSLLSKQKEGVVTIRNQEEAKKVLARIESNKTALMNLWNSAQKGEEGAIIEIDLNEKNDGSFSSRCH